MTSLLVLFGTNKNWAKAIVGAILLIPNYLATRNVFKSKKPDTP